MNEMLISGYAVPQQNDSTSDVIVTSMDEARARRDAGMASALDHAEQDAPGWGEQCFSLLRTYAAMQHHDFTIETFRAWAHAHGLPMPPESRAFGPVTQRAIRESVIVRTGYAPAASSNGSQKPVYSRTAAAA